MFKKIIIGILIVTVLGAGGAALAYNANQSSAEPLPATPEPLAVSRGSSTGQHGAQADQAGNGEPQVAAREPQTASQGMAGEPWQSEGTITAIDDFGFDLETTQGESVYIELGSPDYWQSQNVELAVGQQVAVTGSISEGMIHAAQVQTADGQVLVVRGETGQPLWSGGASNGQGQNGAQADGDHVPQPLVNVDEWVTLEGTLMSFQGGNMTMSTPEGEIVTFQTGQPRFFAEQGVTFQVGDEITVLGFYEGDQFMAGEITQTSTGLRVMLRDPNGRPLWAGPGNGSGGGGGHDSQGSGNGGQGGGNGGQGGGRQGNSF